MREPLFQRRLRMLRYLALGYNLRAVVQVLSQDFGCSQAAVYKDYERIRRWHRYFLRDDTFIFLLRMRLEILSQEAFQMVLDESLKNPFAKVSAINIALKVTKETIKLAKELGLIKPAPKQTSPEVLQMPFEFDPIILEALQKSVEQQRQEKQSKMQAMLENQSSQSFCTT